MRISYRVVTIFGSLVMLLIAVVFFGLLLGEDFLRVTSLLTDSEETKIAKLVGFLFFFLLFLLLWMAGIHTKKLLPTIIHETELGEIRIATSAVQALALRAVKRINGVKEAEVDVLAETEGLKFQVEIVSNPDLNIPQLIQEIREQLGSYIRETIGVPVSKTEVTVVRVTAEPRSRVE